MGRWRWILNRESGSLLFRDGSTGKVDRVNYRVIRSLILYIRTQGRAQSIRKWCSFYLLQDYSLVGERPFS